MILIQNSSFFDTQFLIFDTKFMIFAPFPGQRSFTTVCKIDHFFNKKFHVFDTRFLVFEIHNSSFLLTWTLPVSSTSDVTTTEDCSAQISVAVYIHAGD